MTYGNGETSATNVIVMPSVGDPGVPVGMGIALARAAGFIGYDHDDERYGKSVNQVLIDTWAVEGINRTNRYQDSTGRLVLMDVEHLAAVMPVDDGLDVPRLDPPLRLMHQDEATGAWSASCSRCSTRRASTVSSGRTRRSRSTSARTCST